MLVPVSRVSSAPGGGRSLILSFPPSLHRPSPRTISTPALVLQAAPGGLPPFTTPDLLPAADECPILVHWPSIIEAVRRTRLDTIADAAVGGLHGWLGLREHVLVAAAKDTLENMPAVMNDKHAVIQSAEGRGRVGAQEFKKIMQVLKPDVLLSSSDELPAAGEFSRSRAVKSIKRTLEWTKEVWELEDTAVFAPVEGANFSDLRQLCVKEIRKDKLGMGVHISGIGFTESPQERKKLLELVCSAIAEEEHKAGDIVPVFVHANFGLVDILESVNVGVDLISTPYPAQLSTLGFALAIPESLLKGDSYVEETPALGTKINLRDRAYRLNGDRGIIENCTCACCKTYSKAYIQHLLNTHEMLAEVLLQVHNIHQLCLMFQGMRSAISQGRFEEYKSRMLNYITKFP